MSKITKCRECGQEITIKTVYINGYMKRKYRNLDNTPHIDIYDFAAQEC